MYQKTRTSFKKSSASCSIPVGGLVTRLSNAFGTTKLRQLSSRLKAENHDHVLDLEIDPSNYENGEQLWLDWFAVNLVRKHSGLVLSADPEQAAADSFVAAEARCRETNRRLKWSASCQPSTGYSGDSLIETARLKIARLLGPFDWNDAAAKFGFSSGASTRCKRVYGDPWYKYQAVPDVTRRAALLACCAIESTPRWVAKMREQVGIDYTKWVNVVPGSRIDFVDKNAKTKRTIAIEPCMNMHVQLGIGAVIRDRLLKVGINLNDQGNNQEFARRGSISGSYATLDLAAASDTISIELVRRLLPPDWFNALDMVRSEFGIFSAETAVRLDLERVIRFEKFSSMGNGYTFELESLIFWALTQSVVDAYGGIDRRVLVYGDDIICPTACAGFVTELLSHCGFSLNAEKSFVSGPFRESCGKHYFRGTDVTPIYIKEAVTGYDQIFWLYNSLRYWSARQTGIICDPRVNVVLDWIKAKIPKRFHFSVPTAFSLNAGFHSDAFEYTPRFRKGVWEVRYLQLGAGEPRAITDDYAFLRAMQGKPASQYGVETRESDCSKPTLVDERNRRWVRVRKTQSISWSYAPLLVRP